MRLSSFMVIGLMKVVVLAGCGGGFQLVSYGGGGESGQKTVWTFETPPRAPADRMEVLAVRAAEEKKTLVEGERLMAANLVIGSPYQLIAIVEAISTDHDRFALKKVTRYRIRDGLVVARMSPSREPFPDPEFERAVIVAAQRALVDTLGTSVVPYDDTIHNVTLRGVKTGRCSCVVQVLDGFVPRAAPLFEKNVDLCDRGN